VLGAEIGHQPAKQQARAILPPEFLEETSGKNAPILATPLGFFTKGLENDVPTSSFPGQGPCPTIESLWGPTKVFNERNVMCLLLPTYSVTEHGGRRQKLCETWWSLPRHEHAVRSRDLGVILEGIIEKSLG